MNYTLKYITLVCWWALLSCEAQDKAFQPAAAKEEGSVDSWQSQTLPEFGDVDIKRRTIESLASTKWYVLIARSEGKAGKRYEWKLRLEGVSEKIQFAIMATDLNQAGNDNGVAAIRIGMRSGDKSATKRMNFPQGYGLVRCTVHDPRSFHVSWEMKQIYSMTANESDSIFYEVKLVRE